MNYVKLLLFIAMLSLLGCSKDISITNTFSLPKGSEIEIHRELFTWYPDKELIFELSGVPESKKDRDFSDFINVTLIAKTGKHYLPEKITDINGMKRDIVAEFNNVPSGTKINSIKIRALQDVKGTTINWWCGKLM